ncbi:MAG: CPBP family intramembrane metalloprotease [Caldilineaceae bacterium]|nr:CPBP family intramembrane metalloprotease [Caldilineaceae bacterium]
MSINFWLFTILTGALVLLMSYGTYATAKLLRQWQPDRNLLLLPAENGLRLVLIALCWVLGLLSDASAAQLGWVFPRIGQQIGWGIFWGVGLALFFYCSTTWLVARTGQRFYSALIIQAITPQSGRELCLVLLLMGPVVLLEELLFRSLLIGGLSLLYPPVWLVVIWAILFGWLHAPQGLWGMIGAGLAGLLLGGLFVNAGSLLLPFVAHYVANALQLAQAMRLRAQQVATLG